MTQKKQKKFMHDLVIDKVALVDAPANNREFLIFKSKSASNPKEEGSDMDEALKKQLEEKGLSEEEIGKVSTAMKAEPLWKRLFKASDDPSEDEKKEAAAKVKAAEEEKVKKAVADAKAAESETALEKELKDIKKAHETMAKDLAHEQDIRKSAEYIQKAEKYELVPVEKSKLASILRFVEEGDKGQYEVLEKMLETMQSIIKKSKIFVADSVLGIDAKVGSDPQARLTKLVKERIAKSDTVLSEDEAMVEVIRENPELYDEHRANFIAANQVN